MQEMLLTFFISCLVIRQTLRWLIEHRQEVSHRVIGLNGVAERDVDDDAVVIAAAVASSRDVARFDQIRDNRLGCTLRNPDGRSDVS